MKVANILSVLYDAWSKFTTLFIAFAFGFIVLFAIPYAFIAGVHESEHNVTVAQQHVDDGTWKCYLGGELVEPGSVDITQYDYKVFSDKETVYLVPKQAEVYKTTYMPIYSFY